MSGINDLGRNGAVEFRVGNGAGPDMTAIRKEASEEFKVGITPSDIARTRVITPLTDDVRAKIATLGPN